jgi:hypothetical protein
VRIRNPTTVLLYALPLALLLAAAALGVMHGRPGTVKAPDRPLALPPIEAPDAAGPVCTALIAALADQLPTSSGALPHRTIAEPRPPGTTAWAGSGGAGGDPVVLRCGLAKQSGLDPGAPLLEVNGVRWLTISEPDRDSFFTVGRQVLVALTVPRGLGGGPVQAVSDVVRTTVPPG